MGKFFFLVPICYRIHERKHLATSLEIANLD